METLEDSALRGVPEWAWALIDEAFGEDPRLALYASSKPDDDVRDLTQEVLAIAVFPRAVAFLHVTTERPVERFAVGSQRIHQARSVRIPLRLIAAVGIRRKLISQREMIQGERGSLQTRTTLVPDGAESIEIQLVQDIGPPVGQRILLPFRGHAKDLDLAPLAKEQAAQIAAALADRMQRRPTCQGRPLDPAGPRLSTQRPQVTVLASIGGASYNRTHVRYRTAHADRRARRRACSRLGDHR
jgi:hypothetical protein